MLKDETSELLALADAVASAVLLVVFIAPAALCTLFLLGLIWLI